MVRLLLLSLIVFGLSNCTDRWEEMNTDPTRLKTIPDEYLFTSAVRGAFNDASSDLNITYGGQYAHIYIGATWSKFIDNYYEIGNSDYAQGIFSSVYGSSIKNAIEVMHLTAPDGEYPNKWRNAQAQFMAIIGFAKLTDAFGDIPYTEAGMGKYGKTKPIYDSQDFIYTDMINKLGEIIALLQEDGAAEHIYPDGTDPIYNGDVNNWIRFANSFRLNLAMRVRFVKPEYENVIKECFNLPLIENNNQNPTLLTSANDNNSAMWNPWYYKWQEWESTIKKNLNFSEKFINTLKYTEDPRLPFFALKVPDFTTPNDPNDSTFIGIKNGLTDQDLTQVIRSLRSAPSAEFFARDQPIYLLTAAKVLLYKAEAILFGIIPGDANEGYQNAIITAMRQWDIKLSEINNYVDTQSEASLTGNLEDDFRKIATQMWITSVPNAFDGWTTIRRTGYPVIEQRKPPLSLGDTNGHMPTRIKYPYTGEKSNNGKELLEAIERMGVSDGDDPIDYKVWWDVRDAQN